MNELIYSRENSKAKIVLTRYLALVSMTALPFLLLSMIPAVTNHVIVGYLAALTYYFLNFTLGGKLMAVYLFSLSRDSFAEKLWILSLGALLLFLS